MSGANLCCSCKREGRRLEEKDFLIEHPQQIALTGTKRRKSMEPGKVKPLYDAEGKSNAHLLNSRSSINTDTGESKNNQKRKRALPSSTSSSLRNTKCQHQPQQRKPPRASTSSLQRSSKSASYTDHGEQKQQQQPQAKRYRSSSTMQGESGSVAIGGE
ncbi:hypothetical protein BX666DRAFT_1878118 [Dichotomocladium elegans]|nr:hypothetical protein BX666DRAFT_1878118 [Dichotomocladium elegans]